jgi:predicted GH43/DUF377 family glycosyl hydrolase
MAVTVNRIGPILKPNPARVLARPFGPASEARAVRILARVMTLSDPQVASCLAQTLAAFRGRHHQLERACLLRFEQLRRYLFIDEPLPEPRRMLIGAYFTQEYSVESAALFNPSMVWHPDQTGVAAGARRFILSLRSVGEGHLSSITFRSGIIDADGRIGLDPVSPFVTAPRVLEDPFYDKPLFERKLREMGHCDGFASEVLAELAELFTMTELRESVRATRNAHRGRRNPEPDLERHAILTLAESNYEVLYDPASPLSERIIFPHSPSEINGIEDARWVELREEDGSSHYTATYTAYDGRVTLPQLISTFDFLTFKITTLNGPQVQDKGMALFPRRIRGHYAMLSRQDGENIYLMLSDALAFWYTREIVIKPRFPWEFVQVGNCGSPIETAEGWLVLGHGVGAMRRYTLGAFLLDLEDPTRVIGRLREPLLVPDRNEREGYVPNVLYSCGGQIHGERLIIPYAMSDWASGFASVDLGELLHELKAGATD